MIFCAVQVLGVITSTIGVAIAFKKFDALNDQMTHTKLGVAIMVLVWVQVLLSVFRPKRYTEFQHNCYIPIYIFTESQNYSLLIPSMLDQLFSSNSLEYVRIIFRSENSQTLLAD
jgi:cbb3-type cytochrome oxidase subunit 3